MNRKHSSRLVKKDSRYDTIGNIPEFVKQRSQMIYAEKRSNFDDLFRCKSFISFILEMRLPKLYYTRCGCDIEQHMFPVDLVPSSCDSVRNIGALMCYQINELTVHLGTGAYDAAIFSLRPLLEWVIKTLAGVTDLSILTGHKQYKNKAGCFPPSKY